MTSLTHEFTASLPVTPERAFAALTDESELTRWFAEQADVDLREGGSFRFWGRHTCGAPARWGVEAAGGQRRSTETARVLLAAERRAERSHARAVRVG